MNILILNITLNWVYKLYEEYILSIQEIINTYYKNKNIIIENIYIRLFDENIEIINNNIHDTLNKLIEKYKEEDKSIDIRLNINDYDKIFYTGNISILNLLIKQLKDDALKLYYINIEQMSKPSYYKMFRSIIGLKNIIDYSNENIIFFKDLYQNIYLLPPYFPYNKNITQSMKVIDILSIVNNEYREKQISKIKIKKKQNIKLLRNCFNTVRDDYFSKTKIYINIHCSEEHKTMEMLRIVNLIMNKVIILTQPSICSNSIFLKDYLFIYNTSEEFTNKIQDILNNYDIYYNNIYGNSNYFTKYQEYLLKCYDDLLNDLFQ